MMGPIIETAVRFFCGLMLLLVLSCTAEAGPGGAQLSSTATTDEIFGGSSDEPYVLMVRAYVWGYPLVEAAKIRLNQTGIGAATTAASASAAPPSGLNRLRHMEALADHTFRRGVGANHDTLYSSAWLDLNGGPFVLEAPDCGDRYYTFQIAFADSAAKMSLGQRTHGGQLPPLFIHGPDYRGPIPKSMIDVPSPTRYTLIAGRFLVKNTADLPAVHALQKQVRLRAWSDHLAGRDKLPEPAVQRLLHSNPGTVPEGLEFLDMLGNVLRDWHVRDDEARLVSSFKRIGLTPEKGFDPAALSPSMLEELRRGLEDGRRLVERKSRDLGINDKGWTTNYTGPRFEQDFLLRAAVAKDQIYVTVPEEALYPVARVDASGIPLDGRNAYRIRMAKDELPPVSGFWSITLYDDHGYMIDNPIQRYSVGDRTSGLVTQSDGTVEIRIQSEAPPDGAKINWLPAPAAPFYLIMRLYIPGSEVMDRSWLPPTVERITASRARN